jgi:protein SCO1
MSPSRVPAGILTLWVVTTLGWWAFAFMPLPSAPPEWVTAARYACFGSMANGLPEAQGWMLLVLAPMSFLVAIFVLWGSQVRASVLGAARTRLGQLVVVVIALAVISEGTWVLRKVHAARTITASAEASQDETALPAGYPRQASVAPSFELIDQHGATVSPERFRGRPVLVTFVFAHCQTICPLIVDTLKQASRDDAPSEVLLITLDPWRDTPSSLPGIAKRWAVPDNTHVLSSRTPRDVVKVAEAYGVPFERDEKSGDITHPGLVFVIDRTGHLIYTFNTPPAAWVREALSRVGSRHASLR